MSEELFDIASRFLADQICTKQELIRFKSWLSDPVTQPEVDKWLFEHWSTSNEVDSNAMLEVVFKQIQDYAHLQSSKPGWSLKHILSVYQKIAAVLLIPLIGLGILFWLSKYEQPADQFTESIIPTGQKSQIILADGTTVDLERENSKIVLKGDQKIVIDNEKVIDLSKDTNPNELKMNEVVVPFGKKLQLALEDGTKVWLNAGSRMTFPTKFKGNKREVFLDGEGYFEVAHNQKLPFYVKAAKIAIKVLGTKFNISAYKSDKLIETVLIEGRVAISEQSVFGFLKGESILVPNQKASYDRKDHFIVVKDDPNVDYAIAWTEGWFKFNQQSINDVLNKLQRYYNVRFVFDPGFSMEGLITGKLDLKDTIEQVMKTMEIAAKLKYRIYGNQIYIEKKISEIQMRK